MSDYIRGDGGKFAGSKAGIKAPTANPVSARAAELLNRTAPKPAVDQLYDRYRSKTGSDDGWYSEAPFPTRNATKRADCVVAADYTLESDEAIRGDRSYPVTLRQDTADILLRAEEIGRESNGPSGHEVATYVYPTYRLDDGGWIAARVRRDNFTRSTEMGVLRPDGSFEANPSAFAAGLNSRLGEDGCPLRDEQFGEIDDWQYRLASQRDLDAPPHVHVTVESEQYEVDPDKYV